MSPLNERETNSYTININDLKWHNLPFKLVDPVGDGGEGGHHQEGTGHPHLVQVAEQRYTLRHIRVFKSFVDLFWLSH